MAKKSKSDPHAVNAYLATLPKAEREALARLRTLIKETIPQVEERVSYGTTVMFSLGRDLVVGAEAGAALVRYTKRFFNALATASDFECTWSFS